jgi:hypothetical protein
VLEAVFVLLEFSSPSRRIFIGSHSLPPSLVRRIGPSEAEDMRGDHMVCIKAKQGAVVGHLSDGENLKTSRTALEGLVSLVRVF